MNKQTHGAMAVDDEVDALILFLSNFITFGMKFYGEWPISTNIIQTPVNRFATVIKMKM